MRELDNFINKIRKSEYDATGLNGENCFSIIIKWIGAPSTGVINNEYTHQNLNSKWKTNNIKTVKDMIYQYSDYIKKIDKNDMKIGDIVIISDKKGILTPAIFSGNSKVFTMIYQGCYSLKLNQFKIIEVLRKIK